LGYRNALIGSSDACHAYANGMGFARLDA